VTERPGTNAAAAAGGAAAVLTVATLVWTSGTDMFIGRLLLVVVFGWSALGLWGLASCLRKRRLAALWIG